LWNSFVGTGIHNGPVPPANELKFYTYSDGSHTHPAAAGLSKAPTNEMKVKIKGKWK